jgi:hypothetical protein
MDEGCGFGVLVFKHQSQERENWNSEPLVMRTVLIGWFADDGSCVGLSFNFFPLFFECDELQNERWKTYHRRTIPDIPQLE